MTEHASGVLVLKPGHQRALSIFDREIESLQLQRQRYLEALANEFDLQGGWSYDAKRCAFVKQEDTPNGMEP